MSKRKGKGALECPLEGRNQGKQRLLHEVGLGLRPGEIGMPYGEPGKGWDRGPTRNGPPRQTQTRAHPGQLWDSASFVCGTAAPTVVLENTRFSGKWITLT